MTARSDSLRPDEVKARASCLIVSGINFGCQETYLIDEFGFDWIVHKVAYF